MCTISKKNREHLGALKMSSCFLAQVNYSLRYLDNLVDIITESQSLKDCGEHGTYRIGNGQMYPSFLKREVYRNLK